MNIQESTLVFKLSEDNNFSDLKITSEIKHFIADLRGVSIDVVESITNKFITFGNSISDINILRARPGEWRQGTLMVDTFNDVLQTSFENWVMENKVDPIVN